jgi:hypothetical protein
MSISKVIALLAAMVACTGVACQKRIKTSSYIVHHNLQPTLGVGSGGLVQWVPADANVPDFQVHFVSASPCRGDENDLHGSKGEPAHCWLKKNNDGVFTYSIVPITSPKPLPKPVPTTALASSADSASPPPLVLAFHADGCKGCQLSTLPPPYGGNNPGLVYIDCKKETGKAYTTPLVVQASPGQWIEWSAVGIVDPKAKDPVQWKASNLDTVCTNGSPVGTFDGDHPTCYVKRDPALIGQSFDYNLQLSACQNGSATLKIVAPAGQ